MGESLTARAERVAITGLGSFTALGPDVETTFARLTSGASGVRELTLFDASELGPKLAAEADVERSGTPAELARSTRFALAAAREALAMAQLPADLPRGLAIGGTTGSMLETGADLLRAVDPVAGRELAARRLLREPLSDAVHHLAQAFGQVRLAATPCSACSSGAVALALAAHWIVSGRVEAALAGGTDALCRMTYAGFASLGVMDRAACRPFDLRRAGLTLGEGAGFLVLESEASARRRGANVIAWLSGWALGAEAYHVTHPEPSGARAAALMREAIARAGLSPRDIEYVNAHGTGTLANDRMETAALRAVFAEDLARIWLSSNKGQLGHTLGAAGAIEAVMTVLSVARGVLPPTVGLETPEQPELRHVRERAAAAPVRVALSSSFGFGGMDGVLLFERADAAARAGSAPRARVVISAAVCLGARELVNEAAAHAATGERAAPRVELDPLALLDAERSRRFDRSTAFATRAGAACLNAASLSPEGVGLVLGSAYGSVERSLKFLERLTARGLRAAAPAEFPQLVPSGAAGNAAIYLRLTGPVFAVAAGAMSGESALASAHALIELGACDALLAGAAEAHDAVVSAASSELGPRSEGAGCVLLESESAARRRGRVPLACVVAYEQQSAATPFERATVSPPRAAERARVLLVGSDAETERELERSPWSGVAQTRLLPHTGYFEAAGAVALAVGAAWVASGLEAVLIINVAERVRSAIRLERSTQA